MTGKQFELEVLNNYEYVIAEFDKDNYYLDDENSAKSLECRLNELFEENEQLKKQLIGSIGQLIDNKIDEFKNGVYGDLPCNTIHMFLDLKQEMRDLE